jgi:hypothetical protein
MVGKLSHHVKTSRSYLIAKNTRELKRMPGGQKKTMELTRTPWKPQTDLCEPTISSLGPTGHLNPFMDIKVNIS